MRHILVAGASRGIGAALARHFLAQGDRVVTLSRTHAEGEWMPCDFRDPAQIAGIADHVDAPLDALVFAGGVWEEGAFTTAYDFESSPADEIAGVLSVNLAAPILLTQALLPALAAARPGRVILVGSLSGLDNASGPEVANAASKFGLRGAAQALQAACGRLGLAVTILNPGNVATDEVAKDIARGDFAQQDPIPLSDMIASVEYALSVSSASVVREITLAQTNPGSRTV